MSNSSMLQLSAYGPQDLYLTGNPQITFFKVVYRRHTNPSLRKQLSYTVILGVWTLEMMVNLV